MNVYLLLLCLCVTYCFGDECANTRSNDEITIYSTTSCSIDFQITPGYQMEAEIEKLKLDSADNTFLLLKPEHDEKEYKFVWSLKKAQKFIINQSKVTLEFDTTNANSEFRVHLKRHGALTTTTEPTTIATWPTPADNDTIYFMVNLTVSTQEFTEQELAFKQVLVDMTEHYCQQQNISLSENVTTKNIDIQLAVQCSTTWPSYSNCTQVRYAIPVYLVDSDKYELTSDHLEQMWSELAADYLAARLDWELYEVPDNINSVMWWLIVCAGVLVLFLVALFFMRLFSVRFGGIMKRRPSDTEKIIATPRRVSDASLWPIPSQVIPPLFASDTAYVFYEPDTTAAGPMHLHQVNTTHMLNVDESSDEEILSINSNSARTSYNQTVIQLTHDVHNRESAL